MHLEGEIIRQKGNNHINGLKIILIQFKMSFLSFDLVSLSSLVNSAAQKVAQGRLVKGLVFLIHHTSYK